MSGFGLRRAFGFCRFTLREEILSLVVVADGETALVWKVHVHGEVRNPDGHFKFPHLWPPQIPPGKTAGL